MKAIEFIGDIDKDHTLDAQVPPDLPGGPVRLIVFSPDEDDAESVWSEGVAKELSDTRQDIYSLEDGQTGMPFDDFSRVRAIPFAKLIAPPRIPP